MNNASWVLLHTVSAELVASGDIGGGGEDDVIIYFGSQFGIWIRMNNSTWQQLHTVSPVAMVTGDVDGI